MADIRKEFWNEASVFPPSRELHKILYSLTQNTLLNFIQQWYQHNKEPLSISGKDLCELLCMNENQLRLAKKVLKKNGYIETSIAGHPPITSYFLKKSDRDIYSDHSGINTRGRNTDPGRNTTPGINTTLQRKAPNLEENPIYLSSEIPTNILTTILKQNNILVGISREDKYAKLIEKFGTKIELDLSCVLYEEIIKNRPGYFDWRLKSDKGAIAKIILNWCEDIDKLIRRDGRAPGLVLDVILWCQQDKFWAQNIKSAETLRKQFPRLHEQMDKDNNKDTGVCRTRDMFPEITQELTKQYTKTFLSGREVDWPAQDKEKFIKAASLVVKFAKEGKLIQTNVPGYLMRCLFTNYTEEEKAVVPGHLCTSRTWDVLMPQYLRDLGVIYAS